MKFKAFQILPVLTKIHSLFSLRFVVRSTLLLCLCCYSCQTAQIDLPSYPGPQLIFGSGGGFSGASNSYALIENGQLYAIDNIAEDTIPLTRIKRKKAKVLFSKYENLDLQQLRFNHPGNLYHYIEHKEGDNKNRIIWGDSQYALPDSVANFYQELSETIPVIQQ